MKPQDEDRTGELTRFLNAYLQQVDSLLNLISTCRSGYWEGYLAALEDNIKYFFAHDLLNYARLMPVHLAEMNSLEDEDPSTWKALSEGDFVVAKSEVPFTRLFTDQTLEQEIKVLKRHGGIVGLSQDESALDRLVTTTPHLARIVKEYLGDFPKHASSSKRNEHYQLSGAMAIRSRENALKICHSIVVHCEGNPYQDESQLKSLVTSAIVPNEAKDDILNFAVKGQEYFEQFVNERLLPNSEASVWDPMKKLKLKTFSTCMAKTKVRIGDKIIKLREERELFGRFLIIQTIRPELVPKLEETIGKYEISVVRRALCAADGSLYVPGDKSSLMHVIEVAKSETNESETTQPRAAGSVPVHRVIVIDAMAVVQSMKKTPTMRRFSDLQNAFIARIEQMLTGYNEGRVVFDRYLEESLKNKTRQKRAVTTHEYAVHSEMKLTMSLKELLSSSKSKGQITSLFAQGLLEHFSNSNECDLTVVYETKIQSNYSENNHSHEEADTLIPHQVLASLANGYCTEICVSSPDTDVFILLLDLVSTGRVGPHTRLTFLTGKGKRYREIDVIERVKAIGTQKCQGLVGFHNFSGADWGGKFVGISKKAWGIAYMKLDVDDPALICFQNLGNGHLLKELVAGELPEEVKGLENFVCRVYCSGGPTTLPELRWEMFRSKNLEGEMLPPTRSSLLPHLIRVNYMAMRDKSYTTSHPDLPPIDENGWCLQDGIYMPVRCLSQPALRAVIELTKCGCKTGCVGSRCNCFKNKLPCTPLCKCFTTNCVNVTRQNAHESDDDGDTSF